jgi:iron complex transport system substrate-binding protein
VVGVSRFCDYPPAVTNLPRVGGLTDVDIEAIVRLRPDVVVAPRPQLRARETLAKLGIDVLTVDQETLPQVLESMWIIGEALNRADVATAWLAEMEAVMATAKANAPEGEARPRVLVSVGRDTASFERIYIAGKGNFYSDVLEAVGGRNAYEGDAPYPMVSAEGVVRMNPDIIVDIVPEFSTGAKLGAERALAQWRTLPGVRAIGANRVHIVTESWAVRPGPRIGFLVERFAKIVQPPR